MKDLKHLLYFENLLQEAQNELILQAQSEGKVCVAYVLRKYSRAAAEPAGRVFDPSARAAHRLNGNGHILYDKLPLRIQPRAA